MTDVDGLYNFNPKIKKDATLIKTVKLSEFDNLLNSLDLSSSKKTGSTIGTGGMATKLKAAKISCTSGVPVLITNGKLENIKVLFKDLDNGTKFIPDKKVLTERERWFLYNTHVMGYIYEFLIFKFATAAKDDGAFYTPHEVSRLISMIVAKYIGNMNKDSVQVYDPTCGSAGLLLTIGDAMIEVGIEIIWHYYD